MGFATFARDYGAMTAALIVGIIGFTGVITAQFLNAHLARRQRRETIEHERMTLRTALAAELTRAADIMQGRVTATSLAIPGQEAGFYIPTRPMTNVYDRLTDKLGLLNEDEVRKVVDAYETIREMPLRIRLTERVVNAQGRELDPDFIKIDGRLYPMIEVSNTHYLVTINAAIDALSGSPPQA